MKKAIAKLKFTVEEPFSRELIIPVEAYAAHTNDEREQCSHQLVKRSLLHIYSLSAEIDPRWRVNDIRRKLFPN